MAIRKSVRTSFVLSLLLMCIFILFSGCSTQATNQSKIDNLFKTYITLTHASWTKGGKVTVYIDDKKIYKIKGKETVTFELLLSKEEHTLKIMSGFGTTEKKFKPIFQDDVIEFRFLNGVFTNSIELSEGCGISANCIQYEGELPYDRNDISKFYGEWDNYDYGKMIIDKDYFCDMPYTVLINAGETCIIKVDKTEKIENIYRISICNGGLNVEEYDEEKKYFKVSENYYKN